jgi:VWFA-related protein
MNHQYPVAAAFLATALWGTTATAQQATTPVQTGAASGATAAAAAEAPQAGQPSVSPVQQPNRNAPELSTEDTSTTFKVRVNLVEVRVVVRDAEGHAVGNLKQEDFQLLDNGKPQVISKFAMEHAGATPAAHQDTGPEARGQNAAASLTLPKRYVAYLFDDIHLQFDDLAQARNAAERHLQSLQATDRAAIFTTSGETQLDFTDDRTKLRETLNRIRPTSITSTGVTGCPNITYYMADQILKRDEQATQVATQDAWECAYDEDPHMYAAAGQLAHSTAVREQETGNHETQITLGSLKDVVRRTAAMPGQRSILIVSPGFYNPEQLQEQSELAERALHSYVTINALDARGLYTAMPDASRSMHSPSGIILAEMLLLQRAEAQADGDVLSELAYATGGSFFHNNNDLDKGFQQLDTPPEYSYLLAFSPQNLKFDGHFHNLKVTVKGPQRLSVQARKGYYAPKQAVGEAEQAKQQIQDEVFSQEELHDLPVELHTQFFKTSDDDAKLSVLVRLDVRHLRYRKVDGRNNNSLTVVSALFDRNGNFLTGTQKVLQMRWKDETLDNKLASGITLKSSFDVRPGSYLVRLVVRDDEGQLAAQNGAIEIP